MDDQQKNAQQQIGENNPPSTADVAGAGGQAQNANAQPMMRNAGGSGMGPQQMTPLLGSDQARSFRDRWTSVQADFVDEPRHAVEQADSLVAELMQELARTFSNEKNKLEGQWSAGKDVSTEDLRLALQRYRSFFDRLLTF